MCESDTIEKTINEFTDILFLGASIYKFGIDKSVVEYINNLDSSKIGCVAIFATSGKVKTAYEKLSKLLEAKGIKVCENNFYCKGKFLRMNKNHPDDEDIEAVKMFAKEIIKNYKENNNE